MPEFLQAPFHSLQIRELSLLVRLGCESEERQIPQEVRISCEFRFLSPPKGVETDDLAETLCYAQISEAFREHCESREFCLIEKLAQDLLKVSRSLVEGRAQLALSVHKVRPPVKDLRGGAVYRLGDFL